MDIQLSNNSNLMPKWFLHTEQWSSGIDVTAVRMRITIIIPRYFFSNNGVINEIFMKDRLLRYNYEN